MKGGDPLRPLTPCHSHTKVTPSFVSGIFCSFPPFLCHLTSLPPPNPPVPPTQQPATSLFSFSLLWPCPRPTPLCVHAVHLGPVSPPPPFTKHFDSLPGHCLSLHLCYPCPPSVSPSKWLLWKQVYLEMAGPFSYMIVSAWASVRPPFRSSGSRLMHTHFTCEGFFFFGTKPLLQTLLPWLQPVRTTDTMIETVAMATPG